MAYFNKLNDNHVIRKRWKLFLVLVIIFFLFIMLLFNSINSDKDISQPKIFDGVVSEAIHFSLPNEFISYVRMLQSQDKLPMFAMVNKAYLTITHSWLCNIGYMFPDVLPQLIIIATDTVTYDSLKQSEFGSKAYIGLWLLNEEFQKQLDWNHPLYKNYLMRRVKVNILMLMSDIAFVQVEPDAVWLLDPRPLISEAVAESNAGVIGGRAGGKALWSVNKICTSFLYLAAIPSVMSTWQRIDSELVTSHFSSYEQDLLLDLCHGHFANVTCATFRWQDISDGNYYSSLTPLDREQFVPYVINNDLISGVGAKIRRLKGSGHWFVTDSKSHNSNSNSYSCDQSALSQFQRTADTIRNISRNSDWVPPWEMKVREQRDEMNKKL